ncbi:MAG: protoglobin domain-containing protein [Scytonema sp. PMC 1069.18]|nr:protoglobin domain-containing protein [Scytonema sp. PMC 1069.18]MEC4887962.1 protoglobin domain-containing protein [Scytonema sp. PMC 1070.18]
MALEPQAFMSSLEKRMNFTEEDKNLLRSYADWGLSVASQMADHFYAYLERDSEMHKILHGEQGRIHRLHETFRQWFHEMFTGLDNWGSAYADRRWKIGLVHVRLGIEPQHVVPAMAVVIAEVGQKLQAEGNNGEIKDALSRICMIDLAFIEQAFVEVSSAAVLRETGWTEGLFKRLVTNGARSM